MPLLTDAFARSAVAPAGKDEITIQDDQTAGLALRVRSTGAKSWIWRRRDGLKTTRYTIGNVATIRASEARAIAKQRNAELSADQHGYDPKRVDRAAKREETKNAGPTLRDFWPEWLAHLERNGRSPRTIEEYKRHIVGNKFPAHIGVLADTPAKLLKRSNIAAQIQRVEVSVSAHTAAAVRSTLSSFFGWLLETDRLGDELNSPIANSYKPEGVDSRERVLAPAELRAIWRAACKVRGDYGLIVRMLMLTGLRRSEIGGLRRSEFAGDILDIVGPRMKNRLPHIMPLSAPALEIIGPRAELIESGPMFGRGKSGFSGWSKSFERFVPLVEAEYGKPLEQWQLHDLRRSLVTHSSDLGMAKDSVIALFIAHVSGKSNKGATGVYNRAKKLLQRRKLAKNYADWLMNVVSG